MSQMEFPSPPVSWSDFGTLLLYGVTLIILAAFIMTRKSLRKTRRLPPGPKGWPFFGNFLDFYFSKIEGDELINSWTKKYGDVIMYRLFGTRFVILSSHDAIREAYISGSHAYDRIPIPPCNKALGRSNDGLGIIGCAGDRDWKHLRGLVLNVFRDVRTSDAKFEDLVTSQAERYLDVLSKYDGSTFDPKDSIYVTVGNVAAMIIMGRTYEYDDRDFVRLLMWNRDVFEYMGNLVNNYHVPLLASLPIASNQKGYGAVAGMFRFITKVIQDEKESFQSGKDISAQQGRSFIYSFFKEQQIQERKGGDLHPFTDANLSQITFDLCFAGFDTVSTSLCWIFRVLAHHPDVQAKVQAELDRVVGASCMPRLSDAPNLPYCMATIAECYRVSKMVPNQLPHVINEDCTIGGYNVPKGTMVSVNSCWLAKSSTLWDEAEAFRPERFIDSTGAFDTALESKMMEFGAGRRVCVGEALARTELFIFTTHVLHRFTLREVTPFTMVGVQGLVYHPLPYEIKAEARPRVK